ncbi:MAG: hypothetical protein ACE5JQ_02935 [Candidatus Methylomirabilales bacterium]
METAFQDYVENIIGELYAALQVEFLPPRDTLYDDPVYPVRFKTNTGEIMVGFPHRMVLIPGGKGTVHETVARVVRLLDSFQRITPG